MMDELLERQKGSQKVDEWLDILLDECKRDQIDVCKQITSTLIDISNKCISFVLIEFKRKCEIKAKNHC